MFQFLTYIFGGIIVLLSGAVIGLGIYSSVTSSKNEELEARVREQDITIRNRDKLINDFKAKLDFLDKVVSAQKEIKGRNQERIRELQQQTADLIAAEVISNDAYNALSNKYADLEQKMALEIAAGNGLSLPTSNPNMEKCYYSTAVLNSVLRHNLKKLFPDIQEHDSTMLSGISEGQSFAVLPAVISDFINNDNALIKQKIAELINSKGSKIFIPYLDSSKQHWVFVEMQVQKIQDQLIVSATLHDPRGGGELNVEQKLCFEKMLREIAGNNVLTFTTHPSNYLSVRQSLPDRISCGPIVVNEILQLVQNKTLDRSIPYGFGATEIVQEQCQIDSNDTQQLKTTRYQFLNNLHANNRGYQYWNEDSVTSSMSRGVR